MERCKVGTVISWRYWKVFLIERRLKGESEIEWKMRYLKFLMREKVGNVIRNILRENDGRMEEM